MAELDEWHRMSGCGDDGYYIIEYRSLGNIVFFPNGRMMLIVPQLLMNLP